MKKKKLGKKGNIMIDLVLIPTMLFVIFVCLFLGYYFFDVLRNEAGDVLFRGADAGGSAEQEAIGIAGDTVTGMFPYIAIMVVASMIVALILSAYFIDSSVVFLVVGFIFLIITIVISVPISNFYGEFVSNSDFERTNDQFSIPNNIMANLPYFVFFIGAVLILVLFGKKSSEGGGGGVYY